VGLLRLLQYGRHGICGKQRTDPALGYDSTLLFSRPTCEVGRDTNLITTFSKPVLRHRGFRDSTAVSGSLRMVTGKARSTSSVLISCLRDALPISTYPALLHVQRCFGDILQRRTGDWRLRLTWRQTHAGSGAWDGVMGSEVEDNRISGRVEPRRNSRHGDAFLEPARVHRTRRRIIRTYRNQTVKS